MTDPNEFAHRVQVAVVPMCHFEDGGDKPVELPGDTTFILHTIGMPEAYGHPDLMIRGVPALYILPSLTLVNILGVGATEKPLKDGSIIDLQEELGMPIKMKVVEATDVSRPTLELIAKSITFGCESCGCEHCGENEEEHEETEDKPN